MYLSFSLPNSSSGSETMVKNMAVDHYQLDIKILCGHITVLPTSLSSYDERTLISPRPHQLLFSNWIVVYFSRGIRCPFWSEAIVRRAQMITLVSAFKKRNFFAQPMTWCDCSFFSKALNLAWTSTIWLTILFSLIKTNQSSLASIFKAPLSLFLPHSVAAALFPPLQLFFLFICHR